MDGGAQAPQGCAARSVFWKGLPVMQQTPEPKKRTPDDKPAKHPRILAIPQYPRHCRPDRLDHELAGHQNDFLPAGIRRQAPVTGLAGHHPLKGPKNGRHQRRRHHLQDWHRAGNFPADRSPGTGSPHPLHRRTPHRRIRRRTDAQGIPHLLGNSSKSTPRYWQPTSSTPSNPAPKNTSTN